MSNQPAAAPAPTPDPASIPPQAPTPAPEQVTLPVHEIRFHHVKAAIWKNETPNGVRYNTTFERIYWDDKKEAWRSSTWFGRDDLLLLGKVADHAHTWIMETQRGGPRQEQPATAAPAIQAAPAAPASDLTDKSMPKRGSGGKARESRG
jgi:hypothetical protein